MQNADLMCLNNEFTYSTNGTPMEGKAYTFRANPERVAILQEMGVDIVTLANNHVYDYGKKALLDTFITLEEADIDYFGAGKNLEEVQLTFKGDDSGGNVEVSVVPAIQSGAKTQIVTEPEEQERIYAFLEDISVNIEIDENGVVTEID